MSNLLTRSRCARDFKYIGLNNKLWKKVFKPSENLTFHECTFHKHVSIWTSHCRASGLHFHTTKTFLDLMGCKPAVLMKHGEGSFVRRARHVHLQCVHSSTSSSLNDGSCTAENGFKFQISDKALSTNETAIGTDAVVFAEKLQNCVATEDILTLAESIMDMTPPRVEYFPLLFSKYQEQVYKTLTFPWLLPERHLKRMQIEDNLMANEIIGPHTRDARFKNLISLTEEHVRDISYSDCLQILQSLHYLFITTTDSSLARKVCDVCNENMDKFDLHQLAVLSSCIPPSPFDIILIGKIADTTKRWLLTHAPHDVDLGDLCEVFSNIKTLASDDMFKLCADTIIRKLKMDQSRITLNMISKISLFSQLSFNVCESDLICGLQDIPMESFDIDISERDLTIEVCSEIEKNIFVCPVLEKVKRICISEIQKATTLSVYDVMRYSLLLAKVSKPVMNNSVDLFVEHVKQSDNVLLLQVRDHPSMSIFSAASFCMSPVSQVS